jgi:hypothetical protein
MAGKPAVNVVIAGDTKDLDKALKKSSGALGSFGKTAAGVFGGLAIAKGIGLAVDGIQALGNFALGGVDKLDALGDATARLDTLAKGLGETATAADLTKFGVDKGEQADSALAIAKTGKAMGLTGKQVKKITPDLQEMAAQLASLGDGDPVKQAELLAKALSGNAKAAKQLGVALPKGAGPMQVYAALMAKLGPKLDTATSGTASLADVGERWDATLSNLQIQLAGFLDKLAPVVSQLLDALLPALQRLVDEVGPQVAGFFDGLSRAIEGFIEDGGASTIAGIFGGIADTIGKLATFVADNVVPAFMELAGAIAKELGPLLEKLSDTIDDLMPLFETLWGFVNDVVVPLLVNLLIPAIGKLLGFFLDIVSAVANKLGPELKNLGDVFQDVLDFIEPVLDALRTLADLAGGVLGQLGSIHIPGINMTSTAAGPAHLAAPVAVTINTGVGDPVAIGRAVSRYLGTYQLRGG